MGRSSSQVHRGALIGADLSYAIDLIGTICIVAGSLDYLDNAATRFRSWRLRSRPPGEASAMIFDWLARSMSYQGISDEVARNYMADHGAPTWVEIEASLRGGARCPRLSSFWQFDDCQYRKTESTCSAMAHIETCPLPKQPFRNGNLNQLAYSLYFFIRDVARGDLVGWIDAQLASADDPVDSDRLTSMAHAVLSPLKGIFGVSNKVLNMVFADFLLGAGSHNSRWAEVGATMIAVDTLVHNFLHRSSLLRRAKAEHPYGARCYGPDGCAALLKQISSAIDARGFNPKFPAYFPRYIQKCIWQFCSQEGLGVCNGMQIDDTGRCEQIDCRLFGRCDRRALKSSGAA
jgi:hypothetical protein